MSEGYEMYITSDIYLCGSSNRIYYIPIEKITELHFSYCKG